MTTWVKSPEAAEIMKCTPEALCRAIRNEKRNTPIRVREIPNGPGTRAHKLYYKEDLERATVHRVKAKSRNQADEVVPQRMQHPVMVRPWSPEGLRGVFG